MFNVERGALHRLLDVAEVIDIVSKPDSSIVHADEPSVLHSEDVETDPAID